MNLFNLLKNFKNDESGAVTVDWVVLTAALVGLGMAVLVALQPAIQNATNEIGVELGTANTAITLTDAPVE